MEGRRKFGNEQCTGCNGWKEEGSSATDCVTDGRKKEEGRSPREGGKISNYQLAIANYLWRRNWVEESKSY